MIIYRSTHLRSLIENNPFNVMLSTMRGLSNISYTESEIPVGLIDAIHKAGFSLQKTDENFVLHKNLPVNTSIITPERREVMEKTSALAKFVQETISTSPKAFQELDALITANLLPDVLIEAKRLLVSGLLVGTTAQNSTITEEF